MTVVSKTDELQELRRLVVDQSQAIKTLGAQNARMAAEKPRLCRECGHFTSEGIFMVCRLTYRRKAPTGYCDEAIPKEAAP